VRRLLRLARRPPSLPSNFCNSILAADVSGQVFAFPRAPPPPLRTHFFPVAIGCVAFPGGGCQDAVLFFLISFSFLCKPPLPLPPPAECFAPTFFFGPLVTPCFEFYSLLLLFLVESDICHFFHNRNAVLYACLRSEMSSSPLTLKMEAERRQPAFF